MNIFDEFNNVTYVDKQLNQIDFEKWSNLFDDFNYCTICRTYINEFFISTIWYGISAYLSGPFETAVFKGEETIEISRHDNEEAAKKFHLNLVLQYCEEFLNNKKEEKLCTQSPVPIAENTICDQPLIP